MHAATEFSGDDSQLERCRADIARADIVLNAMLFMESHFSAIMPDLKARAPHCDAILSILSDLEVMKLTRIGRFRMDSPQGGALAFIKFCYLDPARMVELSRATGTGSLLPEVVKQFSAEEQADMPTAEQNLAVQLVIDPQFWYENRAKIQKRWEEWMLQ